MYYSYNAFNQQMKIHKYDGSNLENQYDAEYLRAGTVENGKEFRFLYYNGELLAELDQEITGRYVLGYGVAAGWNYKNDGYHFYHLDEQLSTTYITGEEGRIENRYQYDAFGATRDRQESILSRILYTGQQYDQTSGQYYLRARYYNPSVGRSLQEDVCRGDGLNLYACCKNNPVTWYDPSGLIAETTPGYSVYKLYDKVKNEIYYIGITDDIDRRRYEHEKSGRLTKDKSLTELLVLDSGITYEEARGYEQAYIENYHTLTGTRSEKISQENRGNKINSFDHNNKTRDRDRQKYFEDAYEKKDAELKKQNQNDEMAKGDDGKCP